MPLAILTGTADRAAAFILAGYCMVTALLWKQFWTPGDFWRAGDSKARNLFWDFLKNFSLAGGFLVLTIGAPGRRRSLPCPSAGVLPIPMRSRRFHDGQRPEAGDRLLASLDRRAGRQPSAALCIDGIRAQGRRPGRPAMEQQAAAWRGHRRVHRAAGRLGRRVARESRARNGSCRCPAAGGSRRWTARAWKWALANFRWARTRAAPRTRRAVFGHRSGTVGDEPAVLMTIQLHVQPVRRPCHLT